MNLNYELRITNYELVLPNCYENAISLIVFISTLKFEINAATLATGLETVSSKMLVASNNWYKACTSFANVIKRLVLINQTQGMSAPYHQD
ncbi:hypothetical protein NIES4103_44480 [Nostoc sp. NIES-4103]|nr:hypothetical protein NIES4103_44480 [Nostoc sp. NIES-4103]